MARLSRRQQVGGIALYGLLLGAGLVAFLATSGSASIGVGLYRIAIVAFLTLSSAVGIAPVWLALRMGRAPRWWKGAALPAIAIATTFFFMKLVSYALGVAQGLTWRNVVVGPILIGYWFAVPGALLALWIGRWDPKGPPDIPTTFD